MTPGAAQRQEGAAKAIALALDEDACALFTHLDCLTEAEVNALIEAAQYLDHWGQEVAECKEAFRRPVPEEAPR